MLVPLLGAVVGAAICGALGVPGVAVCVYAYAGILGAVVGEILRTVVALVRRRSVSRPGIALVTLAAALGIAHQQLAPPAPMVILLVVDCMRADELNPEVAPKLSALLASSWRFTETRSHSSWTRSSMPSLLSGRLPAEHGLYRTDPPDRIAGDVRLLAEYFRDAGMATAGLAEQAQLVRAFGYARGFDSYRANAGGAQAIERKARIWNGIFRSTPRFLFLHYLDIHGPYTAKDRWLAVGIPASDIALAPASRWRSNIKAIRRGDLTPTPDDWAHMRGTYEGEIRELDHDLGRLLRGWEDDGTLDNAWLVITADHGEAFGEHGAIEHMRTPWEVLLRVPLVIRPPGGVEGQTIDAPVMLADVVPTLLAAMGIEAPPEVYGRDLRPLTRGEPVADIPGFAEERATAMHRVTVWWKGWKLILEQAVPHASERQLRAAQPTLKGPHLYDLVRDPGELVNLADVEPARVAALEGVLVGYLLAAKEGKEVRAVNWEAAAASGARWSPTELVGEAADPSAETQKALQELGYLEE